MRLSVAHVPRFGAAFAGDAIEHAGQVGLDGAWVADQPFYLDPYALVAAVARRVPLLNLGIAVANPFTTHPVLIARQAATVAEIAGGSRFTLALGTGNRREFVNPLGYDGRGGVERCRDALLVIRRLLRGDRVDHKGNFVARDVGLSFEPAGAPVYVAGIGPRILEMAGRYADGVIVNLASREGIEYASGCVARGRAKREQSLGSPEIVAWAVGVCAAGPELIREAYDRVRGFVAHLLAPASEELLDHLGIPESTAGKLRDTYREHGPEHAARYVSNETADHLCWIGSPEDVAERIAAARLGGARDAAVVTWFAESPQAELDLISALGKG
jgi:5,10-methylenetetrahydromethanopterin reductase